MGVNKNPNQSKLRGIFKPQTVNYRSGLQSIASSLSNVAGCRVLHPV
ncbi:hypothetical protein J4461_03660 [Candidatus Pacearchaeota archaeon]|nr:hypothetical protein [Candidatus Pacearchaeota archaeon]